MRGPRTRGLMGLVLLGLLAAPPVAQAHPKPDLVPRSWELDFSYRHPALIAVKNDEGERRWYWYLKYTVVNRTGQERLFVPQFTIATSEGDVVSANENVPTRVFQAIKKRLDNRLLESPVRVIGQLLIGEDHAKESVAIWPVLDHDVDRMRIFIEGLSGETEVIERDGEQVVLRKTRVLDYHLPGNPAEQDDIRVLPVRRSWVMR